RMPGEELGLEDLIGVEHVIVDADAVLPLEIRDHARLDVVGPVVDIHNPLGLRRLRAVPLRSRAARSASQHCHATETKMPEPGRATHDSILIHSAANAPAPRS